MNSVVDKIFRREDGEEKKVQPSAADDKKEANDKNIHAFDVDEQQVRTVTIRLD